MVPERAPTCAKRYLDFYVVSSESLGEMNLTNWNAIISEHLLPILSDYEGSGEFNHVNHMDTVGQQNSMDIVVTGVVDGGMTFSELLYS
jgi:hypothetical protein